MNVYLVGYRCCGKTSLGQLLAKALGWIFVDTDAQVVQQAGLEIATIVKDKGWAHFRRMEQRSLEDVAAGTRQVVATGGGIVLDAQNITTMKTSGVVVWLKASPDIIRQRMQRDRQTEQLRPALTDLTAADEIESVLQTRLPLYLKARNIELDTDHAPIETLLARLMTQLGAEIMSPL